MNIGSGNGYLESALSNFSPYKFVVDGIECASMEGFLQSLKFSNPDMQKHVCTLVGREAKFKGKGKNWQRTQTLYWKGEEINRHSDRYQELLDLAYSELAKNEKFQKALLSSGNAKLSHSIGRSNSSETVLTIREFCSRLTKIRSELQNNMK